MGNLNTYIQQISNNDPTFTRVYLCNQELTDAMLQPLFAAFAKHPDAANRIVEININKNKLTKITISGFKSLVKLHLSHNLLSEVTLIQLPSLTQLYLSDNKLQTFSCYCLRSLQYLGLSDNSLITAHINTPNISHLNMQGNPLTLATMISLAILKRKNIGLQIRITHDRRIRHIQNVMLPPLNKNILETHFQEMFSSHTIDSRNLAKMVFALGQLSHFSLQAIYTIVSYIYGDPLSTEVNYLLNVFKTINRTNGNRPIPVNYKVLQDYLKSPEHAALLKGNQDLFKLTESYHSNSCHMLYEFKKRKLGETCSSPQDAKIRLQCI